MLPFESLLMRSANIGSFSHRRRRLGGFHGIPAKTPDLPRSGSEKQLAEILPICLPTRALREVFIDPPALFRSNFSLPAPDVRVPLCLLNTQRRSLFRDDRWAFSAFSECRTEPARNLLKPKGET